MLVVADTSPINYLLQIDEIRLLPALYGSVVAPRAVTQELAATQAPAMVREWMASPPPWLSLRTAPPIVVGGLTGLQAGELEAIDLHADLVLLDDLEAREHARKLGLAVVGTLGILDEAAERGFISFTHALDRLLGTSFRNGTALLCEMRRREAVRQARRETGAG